MKRDLDLIRKVLEHYEGEPPPPLGLDMEKGGIGDLMFRNMPGIPFPPPPSRPVAERRFDIPPCDGYADDAVFAHICLMLDHGLLKSRTMMVAAKVGEPISPFPVTVIVLTWAGHDVLEMARSEEVWEVAKKRLKQAGSWTFGLAVEVLKDEAKRRLGLMFTEPI